jgi:sigma-B regulation protein RsbU (phosphoserine phosphatase)
MNLTAALLNERFKAHPANLKRIREMLCTLLKNKGFSDNFSSDVVLAVDEACQNIIRHAYQFDEQGIIDLTVRLANNELTIELIDYASPVDPECCHPKPRRVLKPGGLGTLFMNKLMDSVAYECPPPQGVGNKLVMTKSINPRTHV